MFCALFRCIIWNSVHFVGIYIFYLHQHTVPSNITIQLHSLCVTPTQQTLKYGALSGVGRSWWGRLQLWYKSPGLSYSWAIHYCNQPVLAIALELNVESSVLRFLISFWEAPWWSLVCYVLAITNTVRGLFVTYSCYTFNIYMVSYQYSSYLFFRKIHLLTFICCYCTGWSAPKTFRKSVFWKQIINFCSFLLKFQNHHNFRCTQIFE